MSDATTMIPFPASPVRTHGDRSLWLQEALADPERGEQGQFPALSGEHTADVCIIGGGFTGMWTAFEIKQRAPDTRVILVEADLCGAGASGRNGGFALTWWAHFQSLVTLCGLETATTLARRSEDAVAKIVAFCDEHGIGDACQRSGWVWAATNPKQVGAWRDTLKLLEQTDQQPFQFLSRREIAELAGSPTHLDGLFEPGCATLQPAKVARTLAQVISRAGVEIHEHSQVTAIEHTAATAAGSGSSTGAATTRVALAGGSVTADQVVLSTNAWAARIPEIGRGLVVVASDIIATEPAPERLAEIGMNGGVCVSDSRRLVHYYRPTIDGRMVFGKGGGALAYNQRITAGFDHPGARAKHIHSQLIRTYPTLFDVPIADAWSGPIDYSLSSVPFFVRLEKAPSVIVAAGFSGDGVGPSRLAGELVAEMLLGESDQSVPAELRRVPTARPPLPPEPIRYVGGRLVRGAIARKERAEDMSLKAGVATRLLASLDPTGFTDRATNGRLD